ncbi:T9SS type A sorting domain-containing protein [Hymenobacter sp. RP-2-7]|uniref:T9SS type A sorting domain-containing protein n=1 Tax=Hymenobacter polaris TaxID=2682546 RepID=A0A7Y0FPQ8_9BACT|nr:alkaline phosphatase [Hymenobacter polaris]NML67664.1 T9SS type A sorting domain-containing protein [Hymenobacter polaris]
MNVNSLLLSATCLAALGAPAVGWAQASASNRNVIMYIGDGFGLAPKTAARMAMGQGRDGKRYATDVNFQVLALDKLKYNATVTTHSLNSWITDSAPGASVYACGKRGKQDNEVISMDASTSQPIETILEAAKKQGYAVGLVTTTRITHATPAAFATHIWFRDLEDYIASQFIASTESEYEAIYNSSPTASYRYSATRDWQLPAPKVGVDVDVLLGGGSRQFLPKNVASPYEAIVNATGQPITNAAGAAVTLGRGKRVDDVDLVDFAVKQRGYKFVNSRDALLGLDLTQFGPGGKKLLGLFNASHNNYEQDRQTDAPWEPSLADMTRVAIQVLQAKSNGKGFFLLVEGGRIDHLAHANSGGISVVAGSGSTNQYVVDADKPSYVGGGEGVYAATPSTARQANVYGSDYMIKEVLSFDYAVGEGRNFLNNSGNGKTLIFSSSDHECGGFAVTGLHDEADAQRNGTKIRTYAGQITKSAVAEAGYATPTNLVRGDGGNNGWFPDYTISSFQGRDYPSPTSATGRRIVVAYASNPNTNGSGGAAGSTPGNHTPQDIWIGAEDNTGTHAQQLTGRGLLDNTSVTPLMADFLSLSQYATTLSARAANPEIMSGLQLSPVPFQQQFDLSFTLATAGPVSVLLYDQTGRKVASVVEAKAYPAGTHTLTVPAATLVPGLYIANVEVGGQVLSRKTIKL